MRKIIFLLALLSTASAFAGEYKCFGTEPFWSVDISISEKGITGDFDVFGLETKKITFNKEINAEGYNPNFIKVLVGDDAQANIIANKCNDGMSDTVYPYEIILRDGDAVLYGCCN